MADYKELLEKYPTPFYVFDFDKTIARVKEIQNRLPANATFCYAIKANPFLLHALKDIPQILFEVCSEGELEICKALNVDPQKIVFSGVMKNCEMIKRALDYGVKTITLESLGHLNDLLAVLPQNKTQEVIARLADGVHQFGMSAEDLKEAVKIIASDERLKFRGVHFFTGTQKKLKKVQEEVAFIEKFCDDLKNEISLDFNSIEYGPGFSFGYFGEGDFSENFADLEIFTDCIKKSAYNYVVELGRFVASPCGEYFTKICDVKSSGGTNYLIVDGGINHINYYGQIMAMKVPPMELIKRADSDAAASTSFDVSDSSSAEKTGYCVCGSLCTTADIITKNVELENPAVGDALLFKNIGAYSITEGIYLFLSHDLPMVLARQGGEISVLRKVSPSYIMNC